MALGYGILLVSVSLNSFPSVMSFFFFVFKNNNNRNGNSSFKTQTQRRIVYTKARKVGGREGLEFPFKNVIIIYQFALILIIIL